MTDTPILVTGAAGKVGAVGRTVVELLRKQNLPVRALVRTDDERADTLRALGAEVVFGDLTRSEDVLKALKGCKRVYFGMSVSSPYLEATVIMAAVAKELGNLEVLVNISQMTVSQMTLVNMTNSPQQRQHWLAEQALNWSGLPVVHVRPTAFLNHPFFSTWAAESISKSGELRLPFGNGRTSPIAVENVAGVIAKILETPSPHIGKVYHLTGARSQDMNAIAHEYSEALGRPVKYVNMPFDQWRDQVLDTHQLPQHVRDHFHTMAGLHADNQYDRFTNDVEVITGKPALSVKEFVEKHPEIFKIAAKS